MAHDTKSPLLRFGKPSEPTLKHKTSFFDENTKLLKKSLEMAVTYTKEPRRQKCKCCDGKISTVSFGKLGVGYLLCPRCGHLNGAHEDTNTYCSSVYTGRGEVEYAAFYRPPDAASYHQRVEDIYLPKAQFLIDALASLGHDPKALSYADFGAGSGYFVTALIKMGAKQVCGFEVSESQVNLANKMLGSSVIRHHSLHETVGLMRQNDAAIVSMIGVLEHFQKPRQVLRTLVSNPAVKFIYMSVPLFSVCVFFEMIFPTVMPRQLAGDHTHLYTESSLNWVCQEFGLEKVAEWWFGTDMVDLYRDVLIRLEQDPNTKKMAKTWSTLWKPVVDDLQLQLDRRKMSSEVHLLLRVRR